MRFRSPNGSAATLGVAHLSRSTTQRLRLRLLSPVPRPLPIPSC